MASKKKAARRPAPRKRPSRKAAAKVPPIPAGYAALTPALVFRDARPAIEWYQKAFGAREKLRLAMPDGRVMHAELRLGDSILMLGDESPERGIVSAETLGNSGASLMHYVKDVDASFARAVAAGAKPLSPPEDMFWGDRFCTVLDPFGHRWSLATAKKKLSPAAMRKATEGFLAQMAGQASAPQA